jgi:hypothetical protein
VLEITSGITSFFANTDQPRRPRPGRVNHRQRQHEGGYEQNLIGNPQTVKSLPAAISVSWRAHQLRAYRQRARVRKQGPRSSDAHGNHRFDHPVAFHQVPHKRLLRTGESVDLSVWGRPLDVGSQRSLPLNQVGHQSERAI